MGKRIDKGLRALVGGLGNMVVAGLVVTGAATFCWVLTTAIAGTVAGVLGQLVSQTGLAIAGKVLTESALGGVTAVGIFGAMGAVGGFINGTYEKYSELTSIENAEKRAAREKSPQQEKDNTKEKSYEISKSDLDIDKTNANINLKVTNIEIDIKETCIKHFMDIGHDPNVYDVTYENVQARERTQILMDIANKNKALVIGTGDLSELALGWCTYNGDHMSMYSVNTSIPKTLVKSLITWIINNESDKCEQEVLQSIIDIPISPELLPPDKNNSISQKTEDIIGKYDLHDFFLYHFMKYGASPSKIYFLAKIAFGDEHSDVIKDTLKIFIKRFFTQQFKRSCVPDGVKVGNISLSPRGDLRMPSDAEFDIWIRDIEEEG